MIWKQTVVYQNESNNPHIIRTIPVVSNEVAVDGFCLLGFVLQEACLNILILKKCIFDGLYILHSEKQKPLLLFLRLLGSSC